MPDDPKSGRDTTRRDTGAQPVPPSSEKPATADPTRHDAPRHLSTGRETIPLRPEPTPQNDDAPSGEPWKPAEMHPLEPPVAAEPTRRLPAEDQTVAPVDPDQAQWIRIQPGALPSQQPAAPNQPLRPAQPPQPRPTPPLSSGGTLPGQPAAPVQPAVQPAAPAPTRRPEPPRPVAPPRSTAPAPQFTPPQTVVPPPQTVVPPPQPIRTPDPTPPRSRPTERMTSARPKDATPKRRRPWASVFLGLTIAIVGLFLLGLLGALIGYIVLAAQLPPVAELRARQPDFASSRIFARDGSLLYEITDPNAGKRTYVRINEIDEELKLATVATEDRNFYDHSGFDPYAIARAIFYALQEQEVVSGASTITQQVARNTLLPPEDLEGQNYLRKIKEIILAEELTRRYSKDEILEIYLNNNNYGNLAYGVDAAARTYFSASANNLTLGQASFLAGLPQLPAVYDPFHGGLDAALKRHKTVLALMVEAGAITQAQADAAAAEMEAYQFDPQVLDRIPAPHFVFYVRQQVEAALGPQALYRGTGLRIHTTLDERLQRIAEEEVRTGVTNLAANQVSNGALVAMEPATGHILAMVGSVDFYSEEIGGQVNVVTRCRQPGSAIKPLTYLAALEKGWTPATVIWDVPVVYTDTAGNTYRPVNYTGKFYGPTSMRTALANSLNIPAVKALDFVTVDGLLDIADRFGARSLVSPQLECPDYPYETRPYYGLALTLGGGEMKPLELTGAYAVLANAGVWVEPNAIMWIEAANGETLVDNRTPEGKQVVSAQLAYLITHMLSDTRARCMVFACPNSLEIPGRQVAAKTGTTNDYRDSWTVGYTPDLVAGVWLGNNDNTEMDRVAGSAGAGPIWNAFMTRALEGTPARDFPQPQGIITREVCALSGVQPSGACTERRVEVFAQNNLPPGSELDWLQPVQIDRASGLRANEFCRLNVTEKVMLVLDAVTDPGGRKWLLEWAAANGYEIAPAQFCTTGEVAPEVVLTRPVNGTEVIGVVDVYGTVVVPDFSHYEIQYGLSNNPQAWAPVTDRITMELRDARLAVWDTRGLSPDVYTVRVIAFNRAGTAFEARAVVKVIGPTETPTPTPTATGTATPTPTITATPTVTPTPSPTVSPTPSPTPSLTPTVELPTPTATPSPSETPTETPTATLPPDEPTPTSEPTLTESPPAP